MKPWVLGAQPNLYGVPIGVRRTRCSGNCTVGDPLSGGDA
jgi:hypothetical protein